MENLSNKITEVNEDGLIKALVVLFQDVLISGVKTESGIKIHTSTITNEQFSNLYTIIVLYKKEISLSRTIAKICIEITDVKEVENV